MPKQPVASNSSLPTKINKISPVDRANFKEMLNSFGDGLVGKEIHTLIRSRYKIIYVTTNEELRTTTLFRNMSLSEGYSLYQWDISRGLLNSHSLERISVSDIIHQSPEAMLGEIVQHAKNDNKKMAEGSVPSHCNIYMLLDFHHFLQSRPQVERLLKEFTMISSLTTIVIISPIFRCPDSLSKEFTLVNMPPPSKMEIKDLLQRLVKNVAPDCPASVEFLKNREEDLIHAASGLSLIEAENAFAKCLVKFKNFDISTILEEKKQYIAKGGLLTYKTPALSFDNIGGLDNLKDWLRLRRSGFSEEAGHYGLLPPKGVLLIGVSGTGKSAMSEAVASYYEMPLIRLDIGSIFNSLVGESERRVREVIQTAEAIAPCILWVDEVEKGLSGVQSSSRTDGGVTNRVFGTILTWLQDKTSAVFTVCTANDITALPPEFMRAGRFDEIFFLDLPNYDQRKEIIDCLIRRKKRNVEHFNISDIAESSDHYSPAELEKAINNAMFTAYFDHRREMTTDDIISELKKFIPLYLTCQEEIQSLREWALGSNGSGGRAVLANSICKQANIRDNIVRGMLDLKADDL